jgi:hypothetical protein
MLLPLLLPTLLLPLPLLRLLLLLTVLLRRKESLPLSSTTQPQTASSPSRTAPALSLSPSQASQCSGSS